MLGGVLVDKLGAQDPRWRGWISALALIVTLPFYLAAMFAGSFKDTVVLLSLGGFFFALATAPGIGFVQASVRPEAHALASAILLLFANLFGFGLGAIGVWLPE